MSYFVVVAAQGLTTLINGSKDSYEISSSRVEIEHIWPILVIHLCLLAFTL